MNIVEASQRLFSEAKVKWKKIPAGWLRRQSRKAGGKGSGMVRTYKYQSTDGRFELTQSVHDPNLGYAHHKKKLWWRIWDQEKNRTWPGHYGSAEAAMKHVEVIIAREAKK